MSPHPRPSAGACLDHAIPPPSDDDDEQDDDEEQSEELRRENDLWTRMAQSKVSTPSSTATSAHIEADSSSPTPPSGPCGIPGVFSGLSTGGIASSESGASTTTADVADIGSDLFNFKHQSFPVDANSDFSSMFVSNASKCNNDNTNTTTITTAAICTGGGGEAGHLRRDPFTTNTGEVDLDKRVHKDKDDFVEFGDFSRGGDNIPSSVSLGEIEYSADTSALRSISTLRDTVNLDSTTTNSNSNGKLAADEDDFGEWSSIDKDQPGTDFTNNTNNVHLTATSSCITSTADAVNFAADFPSPPTTATTTTTTSSSAASITASANLSKYKMSTKSSVQSFDGWAAVPPSSQTVGVTDGGGCFKDFKVGASSTMPTSMSSISLELRDDQSLNSLDLSSTAEGIVMLTFFVTLSYII